MTDFRFVDGTGADLTEVPVADATSRSSLTRRFGTGVTLAQGGIVTVTTTYLPTVGSRMRLKWVSAIPSSDNTTANLIDIRWAGAATPLYVGYAVAHWEAFTAPAVDTGLIVSLTNSQPVAVTIHYEEI